MFRFRIHLPFSLIVVVLCAGLSAAEPGPTLKELIRQASEQPRDESSLAVRSAMRYHEGAKLDNKSYLLVVSWFRGHVGHLLLYTVTETGDNHSRRAIFNYATQATVDDTLSSDQLRALRAVLDKLPPSKAEPPIERTVLVSFQSGEKWRTETCDTAALPDEFETVMSIIGERGETTGRHKVESLSEKRLAFKQKMKPNVGMTVTIVGTLSTGKIAEFIRTDDGGAVYLKSRNIDKINKLAQVIDKRLSVTGTLRFKEQVPPPRPDVSGIDEHFYMEIDASKIEGAELER